MGIERERKFLVTGSDWRNAAQPVTIRQGYLCDERNLSVRVRIAGAEAFLTIKGETTGCSRPEFEYAIPPADAEELLTKLGRGPGIEKVRYTLTHAGLDWVVDVFSGDNAGLIVAEVELESSDQPIVLPDWVGREVTADPRYLNVNLAKHPFRLWPAA